ncbi:hypothetical protein APSETT444_003749 [Aspergillus pseudonomiae]
MYSLFRTGHVLRGKLGKYTIAKRVRDTVWLAKNQAKETVIIKGVENHPRVNNELDILKRFQAKTSCLRPVLDEIEDPPEPTIIVLKHFEDDLLQASKARPLNRKELKFVSRYLKPDDIFVNYPDRGVGNHMRFSDVRLGDLGGTCPIDSKWASLEVLKQQFRYFGPWPGKYEEVASPETLHAIRWIMQEIPKSETTPFAMITEKEVCKRDKEFIMEIRKLDWRDRPSARELLEHEWLKEGDKE